MSSRPIGGQSYKHSTTVNYNGKSACRIFSSGVTIYEGRLLIRLAVEDLKKIKYTYYSWIGDNHRSVERLELKTVFRKTKRRIRQNIFEIFIRRWRKWKCFVTFGTRNIVFEHICTTKSKILVNNQQNN